jgi:hypothetical protein
MLTRRGERELNTHSTKHGNHWNQSRERVSNNLSDLMSMGIVPSVDKVHDGLKETNSLERFDRGNLQIATELFHGIKEKQIATRGLDIKRLGVQEQTTHTLGRGRLRGRVGFVLKLPF